MPLLPWDRLNLVRTKIESIVIEYEYGGAKRRHIPFRECEDFILEFLIDSYLMGWESAKEQLAPEGETPSPKTEEMYDCIYRKVAGENFVERIREYAGTGDVESIMRVAETDSHRVFNDSSLTTAKKLGATTKTWNTMMDDRVRDTHEYLESMTVGINDDFYTYDGDHAPAPGQFELPENSINCRCYLTYT